MTLGMFPRVPGGRPELVEGRRMRLPRDDARGSTFFGIVSDCRGCFIFCTRGDLDCRLFSVFLSSLLFQQNDAEDELAIYGQPLPLGWITRK